MFKSNEKTVVKKKGGGGAGGVAGKTRTHLLKTTDCTGVDISHSVLCFPFPQAHDISCMKC